MVRDRYMRRDCPLAACEWSFGDADSPLSEAIAFLIPARVRDYAIYSRVARNSPLEIHQKLLDFAVTYRWMKDLYRCDPRPRIHPRSVSEFADETRNDSLRSQRLLQAGPGALAGMA